MKITMKVVRRMSPESFAEQMRKIIDLDFIYDEKTEKTVEVDRHFRHTIADGLICDVLVDTGYGEGVALMLEAIINGKL